MKKIMSTSILVWSSNPIQNLRLIKRYEGYISPSRVHVLVGCIARKQGRDIQYHVGYQYFDEETREYSHSRIEEQEFTR